MQPKDDNISDKAADSRVARQTLPTPRFLRRAGVRLRLALRRLNPLRPALTFAALLATVGVVLFSPLLLDDLAFRASYLLRPSRDAVVISAPALVSEQPRVTVISGTLSVPPALSGQARTGEALAALIKGGSARLALKNPVIRLELSPQESEAGGTEPPSGLGPFVLGLSPLLAALEDATFETLTIRDGTIELLSDAGRIDTLQNVNADVGVKRKTAVRFKGTALLRGETIAFDATFGARIGRHGGARMPVKAQITTGLLAVSIDGRLEIGQGLALVAPMVDIAIPNVRSVARWLGHVWPSGPGLKQFSAHGSAEWIGNTIAFQKGTFGMDGNTASGALQLSVGGERPGVAGTLAFQELDLTPYVTAEASSAVNVASRVEPAAKSLIAQLKATRDLTMPLIGVIDADVRISAESVALGSFRAQRGAASLALREGQLLLNLADLTLPGGGSAVGELAIEGAITTPNYSSHGRIDDVDFAALAAALAGQPWLRGKGQVNFDLKASGSAGRDILSRLNGRIVVAMPDGGIASCSIKELAAWASGGSDPSAVAGQGCRSSTSLAPFKAAVSSVSGVLAADRVEAMAGPDQIAITGNLDLVTSVMRLKVSSGAPTVPEPLPGDAPAPPAPMRDVIAIEGRPEDARVTIQSK